MKTSPIASSARRRLPTGRIFSSLSRPRIVGLWLATVLLAWSAALPPAALAFTVRGTGEAALVGHDLTNPTEAAESDPENPANYAATFSSSEEPGFGSFEAAFNVFDNKISAGSNDKWCCGDQGNFPASPLFIDATFPAAKVLRHFTLTSGNDAPERDPLVWEIQGSNDGVNFTTIYARNNPTTSVWTDRGQVVEFLAGIDFAVPAAYTTIRFTVSKTKSLFQLSEIEYFETPPQSLTVTTTADENDGTSDPSQGTGTSLREALKYAATLSGPRTITFSNSTAGGAVNFSDGTARTITVTGSELPHISQNTTIVGPGARLLAVACSVSGANTLTVDSGATGTVRSLTVTNGADFRATIESFGTTSVADCALSAQFAGLRLSPNGAATSTATVLNCTISGVNSAGIFFSGVSAHGDTMAIVNSTIAGTASGYEGLGDGSVTLTNCTISGNSFAGLFVANGGKVTVTSTIVAGNDTNTKIGAGGGTITDGGNNILTGTAAEAGLDPNGPQNNGGPTDTIKLVPGSPALDAGDPNFNPNNFTPPLTFDQRGLGFDRVVKGKSASASALVDIGAYEVQIITFAPGVAEDGVQLDANDGPLDLAGPTIGALPPGGTFSGPGVDANGVFHPELLDPGFYTIAYTTTTPDAFGNVGSASFMIFITAKDPYVRVIATVGPGGTGIDVPGEPAGTKFTQLGLASMDTASIGKNVFGVVSARVRIKPAGGAEVPAIYQGFAAGGLPVSGVVTVRGGDAAPSGGGGTLGTFASFQEPVFGSGFYAFGATITGAGVTKANDTGLWSSLSGQVDLVAAEGGTAPGADGMPMAGVFFDRIQSYVLSDDGTAVTFIAKIKGTGVKGTNNLGVWQYTVAVTRLVFRTGDTFGLESGQYALKSLKLFVPAKTIPGQRRSYTGVNSRVMAFASFAGGHQALIGFANFGGGFVSRYIAIENINVGHPGIPSLNGNGTFAMRAGLSIGASYTQGRPGKVTAKTDQVILVGSGLFNINIHSQEGSPVSSTNPELFTAFEEPAFNDNFHVAFFANVTKPGLPASQKRVLIYNGVPQFNFVPTVIARTGTAAAGLMGGELWKEFTAMVLPDSDYGPVFLAKLTGPTVKATNNIGLWATDLDGTVRLLLRTGDMVSVNGATKTVSLINTLGAALDSPGQGRYVDLLGNVSATLTFTDGTTALVHFGLPTPMH